MTAAIIDATEALSQELGLVFPFFNDPFSQMGKSLLAFKTGVSARIIMNSQPHIFDRR